MRPPAPSWPCATQGSCARSSQSTPGRPCSRSAAPPAASARAGGPTTSRGCHGTTTWKASSDELAKVSIYIDFMETLGYSAHMPTTVAKARLFENVARLRRAERELPRNRDIPAVRASLEQELGETVSQRLAAKLLGVSHTGIRRWVKSGDLPTVYNRDGRLE